MKRLNEDIRINTTADMDERDSLKIAVEKSECPVCHKEKLIVDISMALIQCDSCGISFEYRYRRGVIPYYTLLGSTKIIKYKVGSYESN